MRPEMRPLLVFHHLPKTAGTPFRTALFNLFGEANCTHLREIDFLTGANVRSAITRGPQPRMVCGHIPTRYVAEASRDAAVTFVRDPIERVLSLCRFLRYRPLGVRAHVGLGESFTLREFLDCRHADVTSLVDDGMCRFLVGVCERMAESLQLISAAFGLSAPLSGGREQVPPAPRRAGKR